MRDLLLRTDGIDDWNVDTRGRYLAATDRAKLSQDVGRALKRAARAAFATNVLPGELRQNVRAELLALAEIQAETPGGRTPEETLDRIDGAPVVESIGRTQTRVSVAVLSVAGAAVVVEVAV